MKKHLNLTQYEHRAINNFYNLADGHAHNTHLPPELLRNLPDIFVSSQRIKQEDAENLFLCSFFDLAKQLSAKKNIENALLCYSASIAIEIVANYIKKRNLHTVLLEPTFDNIPAILHRLGVNLSPISEDEFFNCNSFESFLDIDAFFLVLPNNPTGKNISEAFLKALVEFCYKNQKLLIIDFSFRFFDQLEEWDQYDVVIKSGCDFIFIEDTGKTWPTLDLKTGIIVSNNRCFNDLSLIHNDFMLNLSPFILLLLDQYIKYSEVIGIENAIRRVIRNNRTYLRSKLEGSSLIVNNSSSNMSVEWLYSSYLSADKIIKILEDNKIFILPGSNFFWKHPSKGKNFVRIALMRDASMFNECVDIMIPLIMNY